MTHATHPHEYESHDMQSGQVRFASGLNFLLGIYLLISAWVGGANTGNILNGIIAGIVVAILAATRFSGVTGSWASWIDALIGIWLIISPWVYGYARGNWEWNSIIVGLAMLILGAWSALAGSVTGGPASGSPGSTT